MLTAAHMPESGREPLMPFVMIVGLLVTDHEKYAEYRADIAPLLAAAGGRFQYDFEVGLNLKNEARHEINRLFALQFPSRANRDRFFADQQYIDIRTRLFVPAVEGMTIIAECAS